MVINMTSNKLKIIAFISMIIDHIGYYFYYVISDEVYIICRAIGRIAMPIFVYLLVQGYFNTKNIKKYKIRLFIFAIITQIAILIMKYINVNYYYDYIINIYEVLNILFSFLLSMILICIIDRKIIYANGFLTSILDKIIRTILIAIIIFIYVNVPIDYNYFIPIVVVPLYIIEKLREYFDYNVSDIRYKVILLSVFVILLCLSGVLLETINVLSVFSLIFIYFYNGKLENKSKFLKNAFYILFPMQHIILYALAMIFYYK